MTIAYWCVFVAMFLPWVCAVIAKKKGGFDAAANHHTREFMAQLQGEAARANAAQMNSFEIFPAFAAAVIIASLCSTNLVLINVFALIFVLSRVVYIYCYVKDLAGLRSLVWGVGLLCIVGLFVTAAW